MWITEVRIDKKDATLRLAKAKCKTKKSKYDSF
jgi:hypothetical protein